MRQHMITNLNTVVAAPIAYVGTNDMLNLDAPTTVGLGLDYATAIGYRKRIDHCILKQ